MLVHLTVDCSTLCYRHYGYFGRMWVRSARVFPRVVVHFCTIFCTVLLDIVTRFLLEVLYGFSIVLIDGWDMFSTHLVDCWYTFKETVCTPLIRLVVYFGMLILEIGRFFKKIFSRVLPMVMLHFWYTFEVYVTNPFCKTFPYTNKMFW